MTEEEVTPLFWPGELMRWNAKFICNIGDELSLWVLGDSLRVYGEDGYGIWLGSEEKLRELISKADRYTNSVTHGYTYNSVTLPSIARNFEAVVVYMRMLQGAQP